MEGRCFCLQLGDQLWLWEKTPPLPCSSELWRLKFDIWLGLSSTLTHHLRGVDKTYLKLRNKK